MLCNGRSGSTLLRFLLDAHPDLACPPETNLPALCAQLATVWSLIEGAPLSVNRGDEPPVIPDAAIAGTRQTLDRMVSSYLERRGKRRYCDKSLGTARYAELLVRVYPGARFICLYRHPMDVIASGLEACPFGLNGYGFDSYIASTPGNAVLALARFWADNVAATLAAEERFADHCIRVRYEDLTADPEGTAAAIFSFLGVPAEPGVSASCFSAERERFGPADYKIWYTSEVTSGSVGRGWSVPAAMIAPPVLAAINEMAGKLGYLQVDDGWGTSGPPAELRVPVLASGEDTAGSAAAVACASAAGPGVAESTGLTGEAVPASGGPSATAAAKRIPAGMSAPAYSLELESRLLAGLRDLPLGGDGEWAERRSETFVAIWVPPEPGRPAEHWLVDLKAGTVTFADPAAQEGSDWDIVGSAAAWQQVMAGRLNLSAALRACQLRYCDGGEPEPLAADQRLGLLAAMLGIATWADRFPDHPAEAAGHSGSRHAASRR